MLMFETGALAALLWAGAQAAAGAQGPETVPATTEMTIASVPLTAGDGARCCRIPRQRRKIS